MASTGDGVVFLDPPSEFNCSNCSCQLSDVEGAVNEIHIYSVANEFEKSITILDALWEIFGSNSPNNAVKLNKLQLARNSDVTLLMCSKCAQVMSLLYKDFLTLIQIAATDGYVSHLLHHLESWQSKVIMEPDVPEQTDAGDHAPTEPSPVPVDQVQQVQIEEEQQEVEHVLVPLLDTAPAAAATVPETVEVPEQEVFGPVDLDLDLQETTASPSQNEPQEMKIVVNERGIVESNQILPTTIGTKKRRRPNRSRILNAPPGEDPYTPAPKNRMKAPLSETGRVVGPKKRHFFRCSLCTAAFFYNWELYDHILLTHMKKERSVCGRCGWEYFPEVLAFDTHKCPSTDVEAGMDIRYPHRCLICDIIFDKESLLKTHQETVHVNEVVRFECVFCHKNCVRRSSLLQHYCLYHPETGVGTKEFVCDFCGMAFDQESEKDEHISSAHEKEHMAENPEKCNFCEKRYQTAAHKYSHMKNVHGYRRSRELPLEDCPCQICGKAFVTPKRLRKHMTTKHGDKRGKNKQCIICAKTFWTRHKLLMHMRTHTYGMNANTRVPKEFAEYNLKYSCKHCPLTFDFKAHADLHNRNFHGIRENGYTCVICEQKFATNLDLLIHKRKHMTLEQRKAMPWNAKGVEGEFDCDICGKAYSSLKNLFTHHSYVHVANADIKCDICQKELRSRNLDYHYRAYHPEQAKEREREKKECHITEEKEVLECNICNNGKVYSSRRALIEHKGIHDGSYLKVTCSKCGMKLRSNTRLKVHDRLVHSTDAKPMKMPKPESEKIPCPTCQKNFSSMKTLKEHQQIHTEEALKYFCNLCNYKSRRKGHLNLHLKVKHGIVNEVESRGKKSSRKKKSPPKEGPSPKKGRYPIIIKSEPLSDSELPEIIQSPTTSASLRKSQRGNHSTETYNSYKRKSLKRGERVVPKVEDIDFVSYFRPIQHGLTKRAEIRLTRIDDDPPTTP